jgi:glyoxylase-like metal-dependent hydrolase (beta-lactamase superfamily II)
VTTEHPNSESIHFPLEAGSMTDDYRFGPITLLPGPNRGRYPYCHSLYIQGHTRVLIDPGSDRDRLAAIRENPGVDEVWLSHFHEDHFLHLDLFDDLPLFAHPLDAPAMTSLDTFMDYYGPPIEDRPEWVRFMTELFRYRPRPLPRPLEPGRRDLGGVTVDILLTPGHTQGHLSFWFPEEKVLFLGDYDLTPFGPYYGDMASDIDQVEKSVARLKTLPAQVWLTSHEQGVFSEEPGEAWDRYLGVITIREARLLDLLDQPRNRDQIIDARIAYGRPREPKMFYDFGEWGLMRRHLARLMAAGQVIREGETYRRV